VCAFTPHRLGYDVWYNDKHVGDIAQSGSGWSFKTGSYPAVQPDVRQCAAVLTGVLIRHRVPITESLTADLMAVVTSREATLLEYLADHARRRVEQVLVHGVRSKAFRDGLENAATWLSNAATAAARLLTASVDDDGGVELAPLSVRMRWGVGESC